MAGLFCRSAFLISRRLPMLSAVRAPYSKMADPLEHATGLERKELEAIARGNDDPFGMRPGVKGAGTKESPTLVESFHKARMIGCVCEEDSFHVKYLWLHEGTPQRCICGHWYKLVEAKDPFDFS